MNGRRGARARGFTIAELAIVMAIAGGIAAAAGTLYLEQRIAFARSEANVVLVREASLALESVARDLRNAKSAKNDAGGVAIELGDAQPVRWVIDRAGLVRDDGEERIPVARFVRGVSVHEENNVHRIEVSLERTFAEGRRATLHRALTIGARRR